MHGLRYGIAIRSANKAVRMREDAISCWSREEPKVVVVVDDKQVVVWMSTSGGLQRSLSVLSAYTKPIPNRHTEWPKYMCLKKHS